MITSGFLHIFWLAKWLLWFVLLDWLILCCKRLGFGNWLVIIRNDKFTMGQDLHWHIFGAVETTLMKLKEGSRRNTNLENLDSTVIGIDNAVANLPPVVEEAEMLDTDCTSSVTSTNQSDCQPIEKEQQNKSVSIISLFARYKNAHYALGSPDQKAVVAENGCIPSDASGISNHVN